VDEEGRHESPKQSTIKGRDNTPQVLATKPNQTSNSVLPPLRWQVLPCRSILHFLCHLQRQSSIQCMLFTARRRAVRLFSSSSLQNHPLLCLFVLSPCFHLTPTPKFGIINSLFSSAVDGVCIYSVRYCAPCRASFASLWEAIFLHHADVVDCLQPLCAHVSRQDRRRKLPAEAGPNV
jgi:hypothetical protein